MGSVADFEEFFKNYVQKSSGTTLSTNTSSSVVPVKAAQNITTNLNGAGLKKISATVATVNQGISVQTPSTSLSSVQEVVC